MKQLPSLVSMVSPAWQCCDLFTSVWSSHKSFLDYIVVKFVSLGWEGMKSGTLQSAILLKLITNFIFMFDIDNCHMGLY
jgi:hypothetical protein